MNAIDEKEVEDRLQNEKELDVSPYERDSDDSNDSFVQKNCSLWGEYTSSGNDTVNSVSNIRYVSFKEPHFNIDKIIIKTTLLKITFIGFSPKTQN